MSARGLRCAAAAALLCALSATGGGCSGADEISEATCPPGGTSLTYQNFGKPFFDGYCVRCHGGANAYSSRSFTTVESIRSQSDRIYANAAAGNTSMPPGPDDPTEAERDQLAEWLVCGAP
jgi:mono/diheme cytochrome c family protein